MKLVDKRIVAGTIGFAAWLVVSAGQAQVAKRTAPLGSPSLTVQQALELARTGRCAEAIPSLKRGLPHVVDKDLRYHAAMGLTRCTMSVQDDQTSAETLLMMLREFPDDPEVLYIASHYFSEMGLHVARELVEKDPTSYQALKLQGEALESQGKNEEAAAIYHQILAQYPKTQGIHYRLGQILLAEAGPTGSTDQAKVEFQKELEVDPSNAACEFILGELARRQGQWEDAIAHFTRASTLDAGFAEAYLALGMSFNASGRFAEAVRPLEGYVKMQSADPAGHYQLAMAYARTGNPRGSAEQLALQAKVAANAQSTTDTSEGHATPH